MPRPFARHLSNLASVAPRGPAEGPPSKRTRPTESSAGAIGSSITDGQLSYICSDGLTDIADSENIGVAEIRRP